jgi:hypothetical protein
LTDVNWYIPGLRAGDFASGTYENNDRRFAFVPDKFIAVKNLSISAQWSEEDRTFAKNAASFGPFSLIEMKFENDTLISPGMQIFAWFCEIMPMLPPKSDPALA